MPKSSKKSSKKIPANINELMDADPDFYRGYGTFNFPNGDKYEGEYIAHRKGLVWREGEGTYYTQDGQTYKGKWFSDKLVKDVECEIHYPSGARYVGHINNSEYIGSAMYTIEGLNVLADFAKNKPEGNIVLLDMKGREWNGTAAGDNSAVLLPEHTFFTNIAPRLGKGKLKVQRVKSSTEKIVKMKRLMSSHLLEAKIFAKSKKTMSDLKFEDSVWYQNYIKFRRVYDEIKEKVTTIGEDALCQEERDWIEKYRQFKERYITITENRANSKKKSLTEYKLFELYNDEEYMQDHNPVPVFYPTEIPAEEEEEVEEDDTRRASEAHSVKFGVH